MLRNTWERTREIGECSGMLEFSLEALNSGCGKATVMGSGCFVHWPKQVEQVVAMKGERVGSMLQLVVDVSTASIFIGLLLEPCPRF